MPGSLRGFLPCHSSLFPTRGWKCKWTEEPKLSFGLDLLSPVSKQQIKYICFQTVWKPLQTFFSTSSSLPFFSSSSNDFLFSPFLWFPADETCSVALEAERKQKCRQLKSSSSDLHAEIQQQTLLYRSTVRSTGSHACTLLCNQS